MYFDASSGSLVARIVYDGVGGAGKTTNLRILCGLVPHLLSSSLACPSELDGRTIYFDWLTVNAGAVHGLPLRCEVLTVPGQAALRPHRVRLIGSADIVVVVCESASRALMGTRAILGDLATIAHDRELPMLLQANKQDDVGAISGKAFAALVGRPDLKVVDAIATDGIGVLSTFIEAVNAATAKIKANEVERLFVRTANDLACELRLAQQTSLDPAAAAELLLEIVDTALRLDPRGPSGGVDDVSGDRRVALPSDSLPAGCIWPAEGRDALLAIHQNLSLREATLDVKGAACLRLGDRRLYTSERQRFPSQQSAQQALISVARARSQLEQAGTRDTILAIQPSQGDWWLWSITPEGTPLEILSDLDERRPELLGGLARAIALAIRAAIRSGFGYTLALSDFTVTGDHAAFVGEVILGGNITTTLASLTAGRRPSATVVRQLSGLVTAALDELLGEDERDSLRETLTHGDLEGPWLVGELRAWIAWEQAAP